MTLRAYYISNAAAFLGNNWPLPPSSLIFWSQQKAGGVLLSPGTHYTAKAGQFILSLPLQAGDIITVVTFG